MKKISILCIISVFVLLCCKEVPKTLIENPCTTTEIIIEHPSTDSIYIKYGYYKEVIRKYGYQYFDSVPSEIRTEDNHGICSYINEFGDTVYQVYIDYNNYPRREE